MLTRFWAGRTVRQQLQLFVDYGSRNALESKWYLVILTCTVLSVVDLVPDKVTRITIHGCVLSHPGYQQMETGQAYEMTLSGACVLCTWKVL